MTRVTVVGQGKLGFPVAAFYADRGAKVTGFDIDDNLVGSLSKGISPVDEPGASEALERLLAEGSYRATINPADAYPGAEVVIVLVPLLASEGRPDFSALDSAVSTLATYIGPGALVVFETTLPIGATRERFAPVLRTNSNVLVAHSPERVSSGRIWSDLDTYPKLVGGIDQESTSAAAAFYRKYLPAEVRALSSAESAEMAKLAETTYRDLNIGFANELARFAEEWNLDVTEVIDAANSQPYSHIHRPGVGVGGHCIPHYPYLLEESTSGSALVREARRVNEEMPGWVVDAIAKHNGPLAGSRVHLLGVAYRGGVKESASSPVFALEEALKREGAVVTVSDPMFTDIELEALGLTSGEWADAEVVVLVTDHVEYRSGNWESDRLKLFVDGRNALDRHTFESRGVGYMGVGR